MKLKANTDTIELLQKVKACRDEVFFRTEEGDVLNLKSTLSCYVFSVVNAKPELMENGHIECRDKADYERIREFLLEE